MAKKPAVGDDAPDFTLEGTDGTFRLSEHRGEKVLLLFYPGDETSVCTKQFCSYRDNSEAFGALGVTAVGISGKDVDSKKSFQDNHKLNVPLLADPDGTVSAQYDAYAKRLKMSKRAAIIIDEDGKVAHRHDHALGLDFQTVADLKETLDSLPARA
jgi:thioredoxin-dependent peroxiredoxin